MNELITLSLNKKDISFLSMLTKTMLTKTEAKWIKWIFEYVEKFGVTPTVERLSQEYVDFLPVESLDPLQDCFNQAVALRRNSLVRDFLIKHGEEIRDGKDPYEELNKLIDTLEVPSVEIISAEDVDINLFTEKQETYFTGFSEIDEKSGGISKGDLVYIFGRPGSGKTTLLLNMVAKMALEGKRCLVVSNEIRWDDILFKLYAQVAGINISAKRSGKLTDSDKEKIKVVKSIFAELKTLNVVRHPVHRVSELTSLINNIDVLFIDGVYLMSPSGAASSDWKDLAEVSRSLKQISNSKGITIIGVVQANRSATEGLKQVSVAGTDAFTQDSDLLLGVEEGGYIDGGGKQINVISSKNRNGLQILATINISFPIVDMWEAT